MDEDSKRINQSQMSYSFAKEYKEMQVNGPQQPGTFRAISAPIFDQGFLEVLDNEDDVEPTAPQVDSCARYHLKVKASSSPDKTVRLS